MPLPYPPLVPHTPVAIAGRRSPKDAPVPAPDGYRWHFDPDTWTSGPGLGSLELVVAEARADEHGGLWLDEPDPRKPRKTRSLPYMPRAQRTVYRLRSIRRLSRSIVREHYRLAAQERASAIAAYKIAAAIDRQRGLIVLPTGNTSPGGAHKPDPANGSSLQYNG